MKRIFRDKKGSYTVFVTIAFSAVLIMVIAVISAAGQQAIGSTAQHFGRLWGRSILAEYDRTLKDRYGLFGFYGNEFLVEEKLDFYAGYSFNEKEYINYSGSKCSLDGKALTEKEVFKEQLKEITAAVSEPHPLFKTTGGEDSTIAPQGKRSINSQRIIQSLPSKGRRGGPGVTGLIEMIKAGTPISSIISETAQNVYAFRFFRHRFSGDELGDTFFDCEIEYIISGRTSDEKAMKSIENDLLLLRNGMNLVYLYSCKEKRRAVIAAAEAATPGPAAVVTQALIMETWAFLEAKNDLKILCDNKPVRFMKYDENWAVSLENVLSLLFSENEETGDDTGGESIGYIKPNKMEGMDYEGYLRVLFGIVPEEIRLQRMMDIIQINMKYLYCGAFILEDYYTGLDFSFRVNGRAYEFNEDY